jgi:hypothetical protein
VDGTLNDPADTDRGWSLEIAFPWAALGEYAHRPSPPENGDQWRIGLYRVEWQTATTGGKYQKVPDTPPDNWAWSAHGVCDMHRPEQYGYVQFSTAPPGMASFVPDRSRGMRDVLYQVYYAQKAYFKANKRWAASLDALNLPLQEVDGVGMPSLVQTTDGFEATALLTLPDKKQERWHLRQDSRIWKEE